MKSPLFTFAALLILGTASADNDCEEMAPPFTARVTRNKVRLRHQPNLDCQIIRELDREELLAIIGEEEDFYLVRPDISDRVYVYSTYVADGKIVGERVNVRLQPDLDSLVITQVNNGDCVDGEPSPLDSRWTSIPIPEGINYYVAKELVEPAGDITYITEIRRRERDATQMIDSTWITCQSELQKPFEEICLEEPLAELQKIAVELSELPKHGQRAEELLTCAHKAYTEKRLAYLESKVAHPGSKKPSRFHSEFDSEKIAKKGELNHLESSIADYRAQLDKIENSIDNLDPIHNIKPLELSTGSSIWDDIEETLFADWSYNHPEAIMEEFYTAQKESSKSVRGFLTSYTHPVKNKPGDFLVIDEVTQVPIAFLYSTQIDLSSHIGEKISVTALPRDNNNFAFPAYFALSVE